MVDTALTSALRVVVLTKPAVPGRVNSRLTHGVSDSLRPEQPAAVHAAMVRCAAAGPVGDGGYWCLAGVRYLPSLLLGIDWGTPSVYHQTPTSRRPGRHPVGPAPGLA